MSKYLLVFIVSLVLVNGCYWNSRNPYGYFGSKTPYDTVRGDIRDHPTPKNCKAVSLWILNRHGNRNPSPTVTANMKEILGMKHMIISSYEENRSEFCTQDIENLKKWVWNTTIEESQSFLTEVGYEELYNIGKRIQQKYNHLLHGYADQFYFRPTKEQRTITSCMAFVHGLTEHNNLKVSVEEPWDQDDVIRPYDICDRYLTNVKKGPVLAEQIETYFHSPDFVTMQEKVTRRLGLTTQLTAAEVFAMYEICRFYRTWSPNLRDAWCAAFTNEDLSVLEYYDDVRHYYKNGYGSSVNVELGKAPLKDLYEKFEAAVNGAGKKIIAYFSHDTMLGMVWCALGLYKDDDPLESLVRNPDRLWRYSIMGPFATSLIAVLNHCSEGSREIFRVQLFINEKVTPICPVKGCKWTKFQKIFQVYTKSNLSFCSLDYPYSRTTADNLSYVKVV